MKTPYRNKFAAAFLMVAAATFSTGSFAVPTPAHAAELKIQHGDLRLSTPWARATPPGAKVGGAYLAIRNTGTAMDVLTGASFDGAMKTMLHESSMKDGVMSMRHMGDGIMIMPGEEVVLKPGGKHIMMMGLKAPLKKGDTREIKLTFKNAGSLSVPFKVMGMGAKSGEPQS